MTGTRKVLSDINIDKYPKYVSKTPESRHEVTLGNLDGNALLLLSMLLHHGYAKGIDKYDYEKFVKLYYKSPKDITSEDLQFFDGLLSQLSFSKQGMLRLMSGDLCSGGSNDYFMLKILDVMHQGGMPYKVMMSLNTHDFLKNIATGEDFSPMSMQKQSFQNMQALIKDKKVSEKTIRTMLENSYLPHLKLISYTLSKDEEHRPTLTYFTQSPISLENIKAVAKKLGVAYADNSLEALANTFEEINEKFRQSIQSGAWKELFSYSKDDPIMIFLHNRSRLFEQKQSEQNGYQVRNVCTSFGGQKGFNCDISSNLDEGNQLGKANNLSAHSVGDAVFFQENAKMVVLHEQVELFQEYNETSLNVPSKKMPKLEPAENKKITALFEALIHMQDYATQLSLSSSPTVQRKGEDLKKLTFLLENQARAFFSGSAEDINSSKKFDVFYQKFLKTLHSCEGIVNERQYDTKWRKVAGNLLQKLISTHERIVVTPSERQEHASVSFKDYLTSFKTQSKKNIDAIEKAMEDIKTEKAMEDIKIFKK